MLPNTWHFFLKPRTFQTCCVTPPPWDNYPIFLSFFCSALLNTLRQSTSRAERRPQAAARQGTWWTLSWQHSQNISTPLHILKQFAGFFVDFSNSHTEAICQFFCRFFTFTYRSHLPVFRRFLKFASWSHFTQGCQLHILLLKTKVFLERVCPLDFLLTQIGTFTSKTNPPWENHQVMRCLFTFFRVTMYGFI